MSTRLDEIRADIVARLERAQRTMARTESAYFAYKEASTEADERMIELRAHDRAVGVSPAQRRSQAGQYDAEIAAALGRGESRTQLAARLNVPYHVITFAVRQWVKRGGASLVDMRGNPRTTPDQRTLDVAAAYREGANFRELAARYHVSAERIRQILGVYEKLTEETIPRHWKSSLPRPRRPRVTWRCASCGIERQMTARQRERAPTKCLKCFNTQRAKIIKPDPQPKIIKPDPQTIERWINQRAAGLSWRIIGCEAGYKSNSSHIVCKHIAVFLRDRGRLDELSVLLRGGSAKWLGRYVPELRAIRTPTPSGATVVKRILDALRHEPKTRSELRTLIGGNRGSVSPTLTLLKNRGLVRRVSGKWEVTAQGILL